jgi:hypothetical protein
MVDLTDINTAWQAAAYNRMHDVVIDVSDTIGEKTGAHPPAGVRWSSCFAARRSPQRTQGAAWAAASECASHGTSRR